MATLDDTADGTVFLHVFGTCGMKFVTISPVDTCDLECDSTAIRDGDIVSRFGVRITFEIFGELRLL